MQWASVLQSNPSPRKPSKQLSPREALMWASYLYTVEAHEIDYRWPPASDEEFQYATHLHHLADQAYADATRGMTEAQARRAWKRALDLFSGKR